jgi:hypothetical protein
LINLNQSQFLISSGQVLQISGQVYVPGTIDVNLKDPGDLSDLASASVVIEQEPIDHDQIDDANSIGLPEPPFPFSFEVQIPALEQSQVMIGEVRLYPVDLDLELNLDQKYITHQPITVTYQSANILAEAAQAAQAIASLTESEIEQTTTAIPSFAKPASSSPAEPGTVTNTPEATEQKQVSLPTTPRSPQTESSNLAEPEPAQPNPKPASDAIDVTITSQPATPEPASETKPPVRKPLAIPELPNIARLDHAEKQRRAAAQQNVPGNIPENTPGNTAEIKPEKATAKPANVDLPPLPKLSKIEAEPLEPLPQDPTSPNQQFEDIWGVTPPPSAESRSAQAFPQIPTQSQATQANSQPALPKIPKPETSPTDEIDQQEQLQSLTDTDSPSAIEDVPLEPEESELRYGFEEDEPQYSFEDPHDYDDPAIAISSDALEFWEDAMRSPEPLSLENAPEELLAIPEILGSTDAVDHEADGDRLDHELEQLTEIADIKPRVEADFESDADFEVEAHAGFDLDRVPNLGIEREPHPQADQNIRRDPGDTTASSADLDLEADSSTDTSELDQPTIAPEPTDQAPSVDQAEPETKPKLSDRFLSKLHILSLGNKEEQDKKDIAELGGSENKELRESQGTEQPEATEAKQPESPIDAAITGSDIIIDRPHTDTTNPEVAEVTDTSSDSSEHKQDSDPDQVDENAPIVPPAAQATDQELSALDDLFPASESDQQLNLEQIASEPNDETNPILAELSDELEQMLIDTDRLAETINHAEVTDYIGEETEGVEPAKTGRRMPNQQLPRSQEFNEIVVDDPNLMPHAAQVESSQGSDRQEMPSPANQPRQRRPAQTGNVVPAMNQSINQPVAQPATNQPSPQPVAASPNVVKLAEHEPVPLPILEVPDQELIAGVPVPVRVKLAAIAPQLVVKIWVKDCQTRSLVDGPRWLFDFSPTEDANQVASQTHITLPLGSMEVAFEAIAVEMLTQRESHKARVMRSVSPPNLEQGSAIDFDLP